jgi:hypothetical protein
VPKKFTFWRNAIISETYEVEAESEEAAREMLFNGACDPVHEEWMDWATDQFELEHVEELDPLYVMVKDYKSVDSLDS